MDNIKINPPNYSYGFVELQQHNFPIRGITEVHYFPHFKPGVIPEIEYVQTYCVAMWRIKYKKGLRTKWIKNQFYRIFLFFTPSFLKRKI